jgi:hypothetical protein
MPATAGPTDARDVDEHRVEADGVAQVLGADQLEHERLARGFSNALLRPSSAASTPISHRRTDPVTVSSPSDQRLHAHRALQRDHQPALVDAVGDHAAVGAEQQDRQRLQRDDHPSAVLEW